MIVISLVIGMGIFATPSEVAIKAGNAWIFFGAWIFGGLVSLCGALTFAEIGARFPVTGGFYKVFSYCYHPAFAFMINWVLVISNAGRVENSQAAYIANDSASSSNRVLVTGTNSILDTPSSALFVGYSGASNSLGAIATTMTATPRLSILTSPGPAARSPMKTAGIDL